MKLPDYVLLKVLSELFLLSRNRVALYVVS